MKRFCLLLVLAAMVAAAEGKEKKEPVVMTVAGKDVLLSEFLYMAKKDNSVNFKNKKAVNHYVELYKNFKLKVADAEALQMHTTDRFDHFFEQYKLDLQASYLIDKSSQDSVMRIIYEREKVIPAIKQIVFLYPEGQRFAITKDTVELYLKAKVIYDRIKNGESFEAVAESLEDERDVIYLINEQIFPFQFTSRLEERIFSMKPGDISEPVRSSDGFHILKSDAINPHPGKIRTAHIISFFPSTEPTDEEIEETRLKSEKIYNMALAGEDFTKLVMELSDDTTSARNGGLLDIELRKRIKEVEVAGFALKNIGDISKPFHSRYGYHILKLLERLPETSFEEKQSEIFEDMRYGGRLFDLYYGFVERMKVRHGYVFYPEAYRELARLADQYFPLDSVFLTQGKALEKTLIKVANDDYSQGLFVEYLHLKHRSPQTYSLDFMKDVFDYFVYEILRELEERSVEKDYPEFFLRLQEFYDGTLLFEVSDKRVWRHPVEEQEALEAEWIKELNEKYPVKINWKVIRKIKM